VAKRFALAPQGFAAPGPPSLAGLEEHLRPLVEEEDRRCRDAVLLTEQE